jgi:hypothetical protein
MWAKIGRMLNKNEIVDHVDNNRSNNKISNLRIVSFSDNTKNTSNYYRLDKLIELTYHDEELETEVFRDLYSIGFPFNHEKNIRFVSNLGRIKFYNKKTKKLQIVNPHHTSKLNLYPIYSFNIDSIRYNFRIHHLVWKAFVNKDENFKNNDIVINHIDNNKLNARLTNLEKMTRRENTLLFFKEQKDFLWDAQLQSQGKKYSEHDVINIFNDFYLDGYTLKQMTEKYKHTRINNLLSGITYQNLIPKHLRHLTHQYESTLRKNCLLFKQNQDFSHLEKPIIDTISGVTYRSASIMIQNGIANQGGFDKYLQRLRKGKDVSNSKYNRYKYL